MAKRRMSDEEKHFYRPILHYVREAYTKQGLEFDPTKPNSRWVKQHIKLSKTARISGYTDRPKKYDSLDEMLEDVYASGIGFAWYGYFDEGNDEWGYTVDEDAFGT